MGIIPLAHLALLCSTLMLAAPRAPATPAPTTPDPDPTFNVTFDPATWTLTWACIAGNIKVMWCAMTATQRRVLRQPRGCHCRFQPVELHHGATLEVNGTVRGAPASRRLSFVNSGAAGSGAKDLTCEIREARFLSCEWQVGPAAPEDVRYSLRVLNSTGHDVARCSAPPGDDLITTRCQADDLSLLGSRAYVVVTGRSQAGPVRFLDAMVTTKLIERLGPPLNVTMSCNSSHCAVQWSPPPTWAPMTPRDFRFEVEWQSAGPGSVPRKVRIEEETSLAFPSPASRGRLAVRVRAGDVRSARWSDWSPALELGSEDAPPPGPLAYAVPACAVLLCAFALGAACRRFVTSGPRSVPADPQK
ncbi:granulocyte-macrophage colony-stimulating factor receptor subunit alpha-like isoform X2 [Apodemus sylvaticus]|uniref:granulocyte-macrophage colony-stimulating factor receptor subunit alpha-like isoform X2 n=1 Tax=Apodemus sylvaticus TaxID=10129 RepID=UPI002243166B|nr:granulocyte-macrophage colony-stimulating factor receptor subunit alpha-like isoform X2 [Apodemus sylvaticus]